jgi:hypothetical protein
MLDDGLGIIAKESERLTHMVKNSWIFQVCFRRIQLELESVSLEASGGYQQTTGAAGRA